MIAHAVRRCDVPISSPLTHERVVGLLPLLHRLIRIGNNESERTLRSPGFHHVNQLHDCDSR
jgi:hypothetical protein